MRALNMNLRFLKIVRPGNTIPQLLSILYYDRIVFHCVVQDGEDIDDLIDAKVREWAKENKKLLKDIHTSVKEETKQ